VHEKKHPHVMFTFSSSGNFKIMGAKTHPLDDGMLRPLVAVDALVVNLRLGDTLTQQYLTNLSRSVLDLWEHGDFVAIDTDTRYNYNHREFDHLLKGLPNNIAKTVTAGSTRHQNNESTTSRNHECR
jgi:hypothetical protein